MSLRYLWLASCLLPSALKLSAAAQNDDHPDLRPAPIDTFSAYSTVYGPEGLSEHVAEVIAEMSSQLSGFTVSGVLYNQLLAPALPRHLRRQLDLVASPNVFFESALRVIRDQVSPVIIRLLFNLVSEPTATMVQLRQMTESSISSFWQSESWLGINLNRFTSELFYIITTWGSFYFQIFLRTGVPDFSEQSSAEVPK